MTDIWFGPNAASDIAELGTQPEFWPTSRSRIGTVQVFIRNVLTDTPEEAAINKVGKNTWSYLVANEFFHRMQAMGLRLAVEGYGPKPGACDGTIHADGWKRCAERLSSIGITPASVSVVLDEPLMTIANYLPDHCPMTIDQLIVALTVVLTGIREAGFLDVNIVEAFTGRPTNDAASIIEMLNGVEAAGYPINGLHIDVDGNVVDPTRHNPGLTQLLDYCDQRGITSGVIIIGRNDPQYDKQYVASALNYTHQVPGLFGRWPDQIIVESWLERPGTKALDFPHNLPESDPTSHTALVNAVGALVHT